MTSTKKVALLVSCLVDTVRPSIGFATLKLLKQAGFEVSVPETQTCCGQPAYNSGDLNNTKKLARRVVELFAKFDYVVVPSGSCASMLRVHYPALFANDKKMILSVHQLASMTYELTSFLYDVCDFTQINADYSGTIAYHDACAGLRELDIEQQPRRLLQQVKKCKFLTLKDAQVCCGFGGTFCVKYADISNEMVRKKAICIKANGADTLVAGDLGCLLNIAGKLHRQGSDVKCYHIAEILAATANHTSAIFSQ